MFGEQLRKTRKMRKMTQEKLASLAGIAKSTISMYENNNREPDFETIELLADILNVNMNTLLGSSPSSPADPRRDHLLDIYHQLNDLGKDKLISNGEDLAALSKYTAESERQKPKLA